MDTSTEHKIRIRGPKGICTLNYIPENEEGNPTVSLSKDGDRLYSASWTKGVNRDIYFARELAFHAYTIATKILELTWQE